jgi:hypothetical protein
MNHIKTFESFVNENQLFEASFVGKPQWRQGEMGDARYSVGIDSKAGKISLGATCGQILIGRMYGMNNSTEPSEDWGSTYSIYPTNTRFSLSVNIDTIKDFLDGLRNYIDDIEKNANQAFLKSSIAKQSGWDLSKLKVNKVKEITVNITTYSDLWKKSDMKNMDDLQKNSFFEEVKKLISATFKNASGIALNDRYGGDTIYFVVNL